MTSNLSHEAIPPSGDSEPTMCRALDLRILNSIRQIIRAADIDSHKLAAEHRITSPQLMCLMATVEKSGITAIDIAHRIHLSASTVVGILDRLEEKGLIFRERNAEDRRQVIVTPTEKGSRMASETPFPLQYSLDRALRKMTIKDREQTTVCLENLASIIGADRIEPTPMLEISALHKRQRKISLRQ